MSRIDLVVETRVEQSSRVQQLSAMFDVPPSETSRLEWHGELPLEDAAWNVGLIVGPSGCGKSSIARQVFRERYEPALKWSAASVIDDFAKHLSIGDIAAICQAVGFNTIPAWMRPFSVLSNGERFRVECARRLLELPDPVVIDEFTSVVDRQVAQIASHAIQKYVRKTSRRLVAISCHYDVIDWLQPDWIFEPATMHFARRSLQRRPSLDVAISRVAYSAWQLFAPFHYLTANLHRGARCFGLFVRERIAAFGGVLYRPIGRWDRGQNEIVGLSRLVTLPDFQGLGLAMILSARLAAAYAAIERRFHTYPAHPSLIRAFGKDAANWLMQKEPGRFSSKGSANAPMGGRPCAVFEYCGPTMPMAEAHALLGM